MGNLNMTALACVLLRLSRQPYVRMHGKGLGKLKIHDPSNHIHAFVNSGLQGGPAASPGGLGPVVSNVLLHFGHSK